MDNEVKLFHLPYCPHCKRAIMYLEALQKENSEYAKIKVHLVDEEESKELADSYDYFLVPTIYIGKRKMFEGAMTKEDVKAALDAYLKEYQA